MSAQIANNPIRQKWEMGEKLKTNYRRSEGGMRRLVVPEHNLSASGDRQRGFERSASDGAVHEQELEDSDPSLPKFFLTSASKSHEKKGKRPGRRAETRRIGGTTTISRARETPEERQSRKSSIFESVAKQGLNDSTSSMTFLTSETPRKKTDSPMKRQGRRPPRAVMDHTVVKMPDIENTDTDESDHDDDKSIDPAALVQRVVSKAHRMNDSRQRSNTSCNSSDRGHSSHELNRSLDLSSHGGYRNKQGDINTSASDDQWARFKLLGRIGLGEIQPTEAAKRLIRQNVKVLVEIIKRVVALRDEEDDVLEKSMHGCCVEIRTGNLLSEVRESVGIKKTRARYKRDPESIRLGRKMLSELEDYVTVISFMYRDNPFHNFEHATTVLSNVNRVVSLCDVPDDIDYKDIRFITTDPWTHFALTFTALIHDVDHSGVPNAQLIKEGLHVASAYKNKSVAEQNSLEISWSLLMEPCYRNLRDCLFVNPEEMTHFRSLVVTATLATDIADKELAAMRKDRAAEALALLDEEGPTSDDIASLKATFVLETLIQVADVSHLMMPFDVYKKWNYRLLRETFQAFKCGRAESNPLDGWYKGEFGFFDFYIIPLAKKLDKCGIDSSYYVSNATNNRKKWEEIGEELVNGFEKNLKLRHDPKVTGNQMSGMSLLKDGSSTESSFDSSGFVSFGNDSDSEDCEGVHDNISNAKRYLSGTQERFQAIQKEKNEQYKKKLAKIGKNGNALPPKSASISLQLERIDFSANLYGGSRHTGRPTRRIVYKSKTASQDDDGNGITQIKADQAREGRPKTAVPDGERRYKTRSKSASCDPRLSDDEGGKPISPKKKKKKSRSRSLGGSGHCKKSMKGKRPSKARSTSTKET